MKLFIDTANVEEIKEFLDLNIIEGCTTNPKIFSKEKNVDFLSRIKTILKLINGPVTAEVTKKTKKEMVEEGLKLGKIDENIVVKLPMNEEGIRALRELKKEGVKVNMTGCVSTSQTLIAAKAGADYASIFFGRIEDMGGDAEKTIRDTTELYKRYNFDTKTIVGSVRTVNHVIKSFMCGAHIVTVPYKILKIMITHPKTEETIDEFLDSWKNSNLKYEF